MRVWSGTLKRLAVIGLAVLDLATIASMPVSAGAADNVIAVSVSSDARCDRVESVCGVMPHDRLVSFSNECDARAAGSVRVLFGDCHDAD